MKHQKEFARLVIKSPSEYNQFVDTEWQLVYRKLDQIYETKCNVILDIQVTRMSDYWVLKANWGFGNATFCAKEYYKYFSDSKRADGKNLKNSWRKSASFTWRFKRRKNFWTLWVIWRTNDWWWSVLYLVWLPECWASNSDITRSIGWGVTRGRFLKNYIHQKQRLKGVFMMRFVLLVIY